MSSEREAKIAVVTVTHDSAHVLPDWLAALEGSGNREQLELCVVDSGSDPEDLEAMREIAAGRVEAFLTLPNVGFGMACNAGAGATTAPTLFFANPDSQVRSMPARALRGEGLEGAVVGGFAAGTGRWLGFARLPGFAEEAQELALGRYSKAFRRSKTDPAWVSGAALMMDRTDFDRIGGFSPTFFMYFEDADLCARHERAGGTARLDPELVVEHGSGKSTKSSKLEWIDFALESVNHYSGRLFAQRYGHAWQRPVLYLLLIPYGLRRTLVMVGRQGLHPRLVPEYFAFLLSPRRALRRLGAVDAKGDRRR